MGIPYLISRLEIFSDDLGFILPRKKPTKINGIIFITKLVIFLIL